MRWAFIRHPSVANHIAHTLMPFVEVYVCHIWAIVDYRDKVIRLCLLVIIGNTWSDIGAH